MKRIPPSASGLFAAALALVAFAVACVDEGEEPAPQEPPLVVTQAQLLSAYADDELSADEQYRGRVLAVSGHVVGLGRDTNDSAFVTLDPGDPPAAFSVQCLFDKRGAGVVAGLKKGQRVTLVGRCDGKFGNIMLRECAVR
jgi:tRNA_anti-like